MPGYASLIVRMAWSTNPLTASLVRFQGEPTSRSAQAKLLESDDPLSALHPGVRELSRLVYDSVKAAGKAHVFFDDAFYARHERALSLLVARGYITTTATGTQRFYGGLRCSAHYLTYMCALYEDPEKMDRLADVMDACEKGRTLDSSVVARQVELPLPVVNAAFEGYEANGWGVCSKTIGEVRYRSLV